MDEFKSEIFKFDASTAGKGLTVKMPGEQWTAREARSEDLEFFEEVFSRPIFKENPFKATIANKSVSTAEEVLKASITSWQEGSPFGGMTVFSEEGKRLGILLLSFGDKPGVATILGYGAPGTCGKGLGTSGVHAMVKQFAPEVRRIGQDKESFKIHGVPLAKLYAEVPPPAKKIFEELGFKQVSESSNDSSEELTRYELDLQ